MSNRIVVGVFAGVLFVVGSAFAEKSMWDKFKDFFSPTESFDCQGPICDEIHGLESKISKVEGKYSRERRPANKERYKKELVALGASRDSLIAVYKSQPAASPSSSAAIPTQLAAIPTQLAAPPKSSAAVLSSSSADLACRADTVYVRDTVVVHDTLYVVVTNKPAVPVAEPNP